MSSFHDQIPDPKKIAEAARLVTWIQNACTHDDVKIYGGVILGERFTMRQCSRCGMYEPPKPKI